ncbi:hypothetical protein [Methanopyrus sp.]
MEWDPDAADLEYLDAVLDRYASERERRPIDGDRPDGYYHDVPRRDEPRPDGHHRYHPAPAIPVVCPLFILRRRRR